MGIVYLCLAVVGAISTWYFNIQYMIQSQGASASRFITDNYVNAASASISNDILVVGIVFLIWSYREARRLNIRNWWLYPLLTMGIALAFAMPLFLWQREKYLQQEPTEP